MNIFISFSGVIRKEYAIQFMEFFNYYGLKVWYDHHELFLGDNLSECIINKGLNKSEYAVIIINKSFLERSWPCEEAKLLYKRFMTEHDITLFPILLDLTKEELKESELKDFLKIKYQFLKTGEAIENIGFQILNRIFYDLVAQKKINDLDRALAAYKRLTLMNNINIYNTLLLINSFANTDYKSKSVLLICIIGFFNKNPYDEIIKKISYKIYNNCHITFDIYKIIEAIFLINTNYLFYDTTFDS